MRLKNGCWHNIKRLRVLPVQNVDFPLGEETEHCHLRGAIRGDFDAAKGDHNTVLHLVWRLHGDRSARL